MADEIDVLLVEDNPDDAEFTLRALRRRTSRCASRSRRTASRRSSSCSAPAATRSARAHALPRVVLLDLKLPKIDGLEVLRRIKSDTRTRALPIVVLTSSRERRDIQACYLGGANSYIVKPVEYAELIAKLGDLVRYWLQLNETPPT
jgi:CheY-like chemotaxis protein